MTRSLAKPGMGRLAAGIATGVFAAAVSSLAMAADPKPGGELTVALAQDPSIVDPLRLGSFTERQFGRPIFEALFDIDEKGNAVPFLAESFKVSDDVRVWTITIREGVKFHDGTVLDSAAVIANFDRTRDPKNRCRCLSQWADVESYRAIDPRTVEITMKTANATVPVLLADAVGVMASPAAFTADPTGFGTKPVGTGPFRLVEWQRNSRFVLEKFPDYWVKGKPYLDRVVLRGIQNIETREAAYKSGQADMILQPSMHFVSTAKRDKRQVLLEPAGFGTDGVYFNSKTPPLDDLRVRKALAHAMDRDLLIRTLGFGIWTPAYSPWGRGISMVEQPVAVYPKFDVAKAKELLAEYGKPVAFTLSYNNTPSTRHLVQSLQEMWANVGVKVELAAFDQNRLVQNMTSKNFEASIFRFTGRADPHANVWSFLHSDFAETNPSSNYGSWKNAKVDELLEKGRSTNDQAERSRIYSELGRVIVTEVMPHAYLTNVPDTIVTRPNIKGVPVIPDGMVRFEHVWRQ